MVENSRPEESKRKIPVNPFSTGGGGEIFESLVPIYYLVSLLCKKTVRGYEEAGIVRETEFQQSWTGLKIDNMVITGNAQGIPHKIALQIKHQLVFSDADSNEDFKKVVKDRYPRTLSTRPRLGPDLTKTGRFLRDGILFKGTPRMQRGEDAANRTLTL